jgi:hypothetical protein
MHDDDIRIVARSRELVHQPVLPDPGSRYAEIHDFGVAAVTAQRCLYKGEDVLRIGHHAVRERVAQCHDPPGADGLRDRELLARESKRIGVVIVPDPVWREVHPELAQEVFERSIGARHVADPGSREILHIEPDACRDAHEDLGRDQCDRKADRQQEYPIDKFFDRH